MPMTESHIHKLDSSLTFLNYSKEEEFFFQNYFHPLLLEKISSWTEHAQVQWLKITALPIGPEH